MTTMKPADRYPAGGVQRRAHARVVVGSRAAIEAWQRGDQEVLVEHGRLTDGRPATRVSLPQHAPRTVAYRRPRRGLGPAAWAGIAAGALSALFGAGWAAWWLLSWLLAGLAEHAAGVAGAAALALLVVSAAGGTACTVVVKVTHRH